MKRAIMTAIMCIAALAVLLAGCGGKVLDRPPEMTDGAGGVDRPPEMTDGAEQVKTLQFWVGEKVEEGDLDGLTFIPGMFGGDMYLAAGYLPSTDEDGNATAPELCVVYTVTQYPDYSSPDSAVTGIEITDPAVTVYGIGCNSSIEDFVAVFGDLGCQTEHTERYATATYGKTRLSLTAVDGARSLRISVEVTNNTGMIF